MNNIQQQRNVVYSNNTEHHGHSTAETRSQNRTLTHSFSKYETVIRKHFWYLSLSDNADSTSCTAVKYL